MSNQSTFGKGTDFDFRGLLIETLKYWDQLFVGKKPDIDPNGLDVYRYAG